MTPVGEMNMYVTDTEMKKILNSTKYDIFSIVIIIVLVDL
jgi:hypothetical protein